MLKKFISFFLKNKKQIIFIHGGECFNSYQEYFQSIVDAEFDPSQKRKKRWNSNLKKFFWRYELIAPKMPSKFNAKYKEWEIYFQKVLPWIKKDSIWIGYSLGGIFLIKFLSENNIKEYPKKLILLSAPFNREWINDFGKKEGLSDFIFDIQKVKKKLKKINKIYILHSKDDFVVPFEHALEYKKILPFAKLITFTNKPHFLIKKFPELLEYI